MTVYEDTHSHYITQLFAGQDPVQEQILKEIPRRGLPTITVKPEEGRFLQFLVRAVGACKAVEIGTLGGYSGIWIGRGLPPGGRLITLEKEPERAEFSRQNIEQAGLKEMIEIRVGDAHQMLKDMAGEGPFDFVFIDAEKDGYADYYQWAVANVRSGGVIAAHNAFRKGSVAGTIPNDEFTEGMRHFNQMVAEDERVISTIFPAGDGTLVAVKK